MFVLPRPLWVQSRKCSCLHGTSVVPLKSGGRQAQAEVHSIAHVSSHPYPTQLSQCLGQLQSLLARENLRPQPPAREIIPIEISGWPVARESHLEDPAHGRARKHRRL